MRNIRLSINVLKKPVVAFCGALIFAASGVWAQPTGGCPVQSYYHKNPFMQQECLNEQCDPPTISMLRSANPRIIYVDSHRFIPFEKIFGEDNDPRTTEDNFTGSDEAIRRELGFLGINDENFLRGIMQNNPLSLNSGSRSFCSMVGGEFTCAISSTIRDVSPEFFMGALSKHLSANMLGIRTYSRAYYKDHARRIDKLHCPNMASSDGLRAFMVARSYAESLLWPRPAMGRNLMVYEMTADAFAIMAVAMAYGYDANLVQTVDYARRAAPLFAEVEMATAPAVRSAGQFVQNFPRTEMSYYEYTNATSPPVIKTRDIEYSDLIGFIKPPDFYEYPTRKMCFSNDNWRGAYDDAVLLQVARQIAQALAWPDSEIQTVKVGLIQATQSTPTIRNSDTARVWLTKLSDLSVDSPYYIRLVSEFLTLFNDCNPE